MNRQELARCRFNSHDYCSLVLFVLRIHYLQPDCLKISAFSVVYNFQGIIMTFQQIYKYNKFTLPIINIILAVYPLKELGPLPRNLTAF